MIIHSAKFISSSPTINECPVTVHPEFAFIGRSNVGKSSLINMLTGFSRLARISVQPGKTRTINHFLINDEWFLVDLPGYGYAKVPSKLREKWSSHSREYILKRLNLASLFVLIDSRHEPQASDLDFMEFLGINNIPFARVFTKTDKTSSMALEKSIKKYDMIMSEKWESIPSTFKASAVKGSGREDILDYIEDSLKNFASGA
jgi:GTP-binding protein